MTKKYEDLDFTDNFFFCKILTKNEKLCKELLELILQIKIAKIVFATEQKPIEVTADGKGIRLDVYVEDDAQSVYDIEMQPTMKKNLPKRTRYYQGMIDLGMIERGADYKELKKSFIIFICLSDPFSEGLPIYTFENQCRECPKLFLGDETTKVFINATGTADGVSDEMKKFLDYLQGKGSHNDFTRHIDDEVTKARAHEEWRLEYMSLFLRDQDMRAEGRVQEAAENAKRLFENGASYQLVRDSIVNLTDEEMQAIYDEVMKNKEK